MKKAYFFIDDTIWVLRDITRERPASLFDNPFLKMLKANHDKYGMKVQLNIFYRTDIYYGYDEFTLADVTDAYKAEWEANSDWLKLAFHALQEFPDYPHLNATYEDTLRLFNEIKTEVLRFAGEKSFAYEICAHWAPVSLAACRALHDSGVKLLHATYGKSSPYNEDPSSLPYGHAARLIRNRQPEARIYRSTDRKEDIACAICAQNHLEPEQAEHVLDNSKAIFDEASGLFFKTLGDITLNIYDYDKLDEVFASRLGREYIGICIHEQYFYPDYFAYQPDYADKIEKMCRILTENGYTFINGDKILD